MISALATTKNGTQANRCYNDNSHVSSHIIASAKAKARLRHQKKTKWRYFSNELAVNCFRNFCTVYDNWALPYRQQTVSQADARCYVWPCCQKSNALRFSLHLHLSNFVYNRLTHNRYWNTECSGFCIPCAIHCYKLYCFCNLAAYFSQQFWYY